MYTTGLANRRANSVQNKNENVNHPNAPNKITNPKSTKADNDKRFGFD